jgi:hypothetical protein
MTSRQRKQAGGGRGWAPVAWIDCTCPQLLTASAGFQFHGKLCRYRHNLPWVWSTQGSGDKQAA